jgi:hypothetical protein
MQARAKRLLRSDYVTIRRRSRTKPPGLPPLPPASTSWPATSFSGATRDSFRSNRSIDANTVSAAATLHCLLPPPSSPSPLNAHLLCLSTCTNTCPTFPILLTVSTAPLFSHFLPLPLPPPTPPSHPSPRHHHPFNGHHQLIGGCKGMCHITRHTHHATRHTSLATRHTPHATRHTSLATRHTPHVTRHTSYATRHTPHVTRHTSHSSAW